WRRRIATDPRSRERIVLEQRHLVILGDRRECSSSLLVEDAADWILIGGDDVHQPWLCSCHLVLERIDVDAVSSSAHSNEARAERGKGIEGAGIGRVFDQRRVATLQIEPPGKIDRLLRA